MPSDNNWQRAVMDRAIEIAGGNAPEEGDFNTAMIQLHHLVPESEMALLQAELRSVDHSDEDFDDCDYNYGHDHDDFEDEEDCEVCGAPPGFFCDCIA